MEYKKIKLMNGIAVVSTDYIVVEQTRTEKSNYAGIVAEKKGTLPHYLVLSDKPICEYSAEDEEHLYEFLGGIFPEIGEVRSKEVEAVFENGTIKNADEWMESPRLGLFAVREVPDMDNLYFDTGIIREEE